MPTPSIFHSHTNTQTRYSDDWKNHTLEIKETFLRTFSLSILILVIKENYEEWVYSSSELYPLWFRALSTHFFRPLSSLPLSFFRRSYFLAISALSFHLPLFVTLYFHYILSYFLRPYLTDFPLYIRSFHFMEQSTKAVSYTHLDVYKRQTFEFGNVACHQFLFVSRYAQLGRHRGRES